MILNQNLKNLKKWFIIVLHNPTFYTFSNLPRTPLLNLLELYDPPLENEPDCPNPPILPNRLFNKLDTTFCGSLPPHPPEQPEPPPYDPPYPPVNPPEPPPKPKPPPLPEP